MAVKNSNAVNIAIGRAVSELALAGTKIQKHSIINKLDKYILTSAGKEKTIYTLAAEVVRDSKHVFSDE